MWMQLQQMEQLKRQLAQEEKLRAQAETQLQENRGFRRSVADARAQLDSQAQEMENLRRQCTEAQDQAERYRARAQSSEKEAEDVKAKLLKEISQKSQEAQQLRASLSSMKAKASEEKPCSGQEIEQLRSKYEKVLQVLRGSQLAESNSELDFLKTQLQALQRQTDSNQQRVQAIEASKIKAAASPGSAPSETAPQKPAQSAKDDHRALVSKVVHHAIVRGMATTGAQQSCDAECQTELPAEYLIAEGVHEESDALALKSEQLAEAETAILTLQAKLSTAVREIVELKKVNELFEKAKSDVLTLQAKLSNAETTSNERCCRVMENSMQVLEAKHVEERESLLAQLAEVRQEKLALESKSAQPCDQLPVEQQPAPAAIGQECSGCKQTLAQNKELLVTVSVLQRTCSHLEAENKGLRQSLADCEENVDRISSQHAELIGHANSHQKIQHIKQLKDRHKQVEVELTKAKQRILQLEARQTGQSLLDALAALAPSTPASASPSSATAKARATSRRSLQGTSSAPVSTDQGPRCKQLELQLEHILITFQHFMALMEHAVSGPCQPGATVDTDDSTVARMLQQLRNLASQKQQ
eukprot:TRINITY_DN93236_c0_g1_i1.p1 TRINITY_DN93236_c0_g1~~TRINITY_DN93236_c0_g1_i1.p1  ORF type:complete len:665 (-),score=165.16 TRINITY_DN93236_c0_g1_i1:202-1965(-)